MQVENPMGGAGYGTLAVTRDHWGPLKQGWAPPRTATLPERPKITALLGLEGTCGDHLVQLLSRQGHRNVSK